MGLIEKLAEDIGRIAKALERITSVSSTPVPGPVAEEATPAPAAVVETETPPTPAQAVAADFPTMEDAVETLRTFLDAGSNRDAAREILGKFDAESITTLKPESYADFIAAVKAY